MTAFWVKESDGVFKFWLHKAATDQTAHGADTLVVFIHGILSNPGMWEKVVPRLIRTYNFHALAFGYPVWPHLAGSNKKAAEKLQTKLIDLKEKLDYRHLVFVSHSNGGLVVREMFRAMFDDGAIAPWRRLAANQMNDYDRLVAAARLVIDVCSPHEGARGPWKIAALAVWTMCLMTFGLCNLIRSLFPGTAKLGANSISWTLSGKDIRLHQNNKLWGKATVQASTNKWPWPARFAYGTEQDFYAQYKRALRTLSGSHYWPHDFSHAVYRKLTKLLAHLRSSAALNFAERTCILSHQVNAQLNVTALESEQVEPAPVGQQAQVFNYLLAQLNDPHAKVRKYLVTGIGGVGKSRLLSFLSRHITSQRLSDCHDGDAKAALPVHNILHFPFPRPDLEGASAELVASLRTLKSFVQTKATTKAGTTQNNLDARKALEVQKTYDLLLEGAAHYAREVHAPKHTTAQSLDKALHQDNENRKWVVVADGVDELLLRYPFLTLEGVTAALSRMAEHTDGYCVISSRSGLANLHTLTESGWATCRVVPRDLASIIADHPEVTRVFDLIRRYPIPAVDTKEMLDIFTTALFVKSLTRQASNIVSESIRPENVQRAPAVGCIVDVLARCFEDLIHHGPDGEYLKLPFDLTTDIVMDVLSVISRVFYEKNDQVLSIEQIKEGIGRVVEMWRHELAESEETAGIARRVLAAKDMMESVCPEAVGWILRSVFIALPGNRWSFSHRMWYEFFVARYYALAARCQFVKEMGMFGYTPIITGMAGQFMGEWTVPAKLVREARERTLFESNPLYICNLLALTTWNVRAILDGGARTEMFECIASGDKRDLDSFSRVFVTNGLAFRIALARQLGQTNSPIVQVWPALLAAQLRLAANGSDVLVQSLAACHLKAMGEQMPDAGLGTDLRHLDLAKPMWDFDEAARRIRGNAQRMADSVQVSLQPLIRYAMDANLDTYINRRVATVHYLYFLCAASVRDRDLPSTSYLLADVFGEESALLGSIATERDPDNPAAIPALADLFDRCERIWCRDFELTPTR